MKHRGSTTINCNIHEVIVLLCFEFGFHIMTKVDKNYAHGNGQNMSQSQSKSQNVETRGKLKARLSLRFRVKTRQWVRINIRFKVMA